MASPLRKARFRTVHSIIPILVAIPAALAAQPRIAAREMARARPEARDLVRRLEMRRALDPDFETKLRAAEKQFGLGPKIREEGAKRAAFVLDEMRRTNGPVTLRAPERPQARPVITFEPARPGRSVRDAQQKLADLGYLRPGGDVDGKFGPKTRRALESFQKDHQLPVSGTLDWITERALVPDSFNQDFSQSLRAMFRLENLNTNLSARYRLLDPSGEVVFWGDDQPQLARKIGEISGGRRMYVEMDGFTPEKAEALVASFQIQQPLIDLVVIPHFTEDPGLREALFKAGAHLEDRAAQIHKFEAGEDVGKFEYTPTARVGVYSAKLRIVSAVWAWIGEFMAPLRWRLQFRSLFTHSTIFDTNPDANPSLSTAIDGALKELKSRHPGLTKEQFRIEIMRQFGNINLGEVRGRNRLVWS